MTNSSWRSQEPSTYIPNSLVIQLFCYSFFLNGPLLYLYRNLTRMSSDKRTPIINMGIYKLEYMLRVH